MKATEGRKPPKILLCAGQGCADTETCARYRIRGADFKWASFDLERSLPKHETKPCPAYLEYREPRKGAPR
jgi:hypothetical protein